MFIRDIQAKHEDGQYRVQAEVAYETRPRQETIFFSVPSEQADWIRPEPNAFMVGTAIAAMWNGENTLAIEGNVDPQLRTRLTIAMRLLTSWHKSPLRPVDIVAPAAPRALPDIPRSTTALFLSGGVDSLSALYWNASQYQKGDPRRVSVAFFVHGLDVGDPNKPNRLDVWSLGIQTLSALCQELEVELVTVKVNLRDLAPSWRLYGSWQHASLLASIAHAASSRIYRCIIAPDYPVEYIPHPHGSHPWLNSYFGADFLEIVTGDMEQFSRLQKVRFLSTQPGVLDALRVCWDAGAIPQGYLNCGRCLKCVRTMLAFMACGQLATTKAFPFKDVTADMMRATPIRTPIELAFYLELLAPLEAMGRKDLMTLIKRKMWLFQTEHALRLHYLRPVAKKFLGRR
ncbi:hypothetical protein [Thiobacillus sp.]|uniref:hypothetical protein n=1 Tax=Thiobacillus sp. TaxID=924 RepID=UPI0011D64961|nr:hypothetical protein [Thiobacillus sp.]TXH76111.1 MAG: hypothetical protein E6Q82_03690 [Thiobacillus sp.]